MSKAERLYSAPQGPGVSELRTEFDKLVEDVAFIKSAICFIAASNPNFSQHVGALCMAHPLLALELSKEMRAHTDGLQKALEFERAEAAIQAAQATEAEYAEAR